jgi:TolA-binding protein
VKKGLGNSKLNESQKEALNAFLLEIQLAKGDTKAAGETAAKVGGAGAGAGTAAGAGAGLGAAAGGADNTVAAAARATGKIASNKLALSEKKYDKVLKDLEESRELFVEPADQAEVLFMLAEARSGLAGDDEQKLKDAALEYMRVVAHFKDAQDAPHVAESLFKTAQILEKLKDAKTAQDTYQQVATQYPNSAVAAQAKENAERIQKALEQ